MLQVSGGVIAVRAARLLFFSCRIVANSSGIVQGCLRLVHNGAGLCFKTLRFVYIFAPLWMFSPQSDGETGHCIYV